MAFNACFIWYGFALPFTFCNVSLPLYSGCVKITWIPLPALSMNPHDKSQLMASSNLTFSGLFFILSCNFSF